MITHWVSQVEKWKFLPTGAATYLGPQPQTERPFGLCVSSTELTEGTVRFSVFIPTPHLSSEGPSAALVLGYASLNDHYYAIGIGGHDLKYTLVNYEPAAGWRLLKGAGSAYDLKTPRKFLLSVRIQASKIGLYDEGNLVFEHALPNSFANGGRVGLAASIARSDAGRTTPLPPACRAKCAWRRTSDRSQGSWSEPSHRALHRSGCADCAVVSAKHRSHRARHRAPRTTSPPARPPGASQ